MPFEPVATQCRVYCLGFRVQDLGFRFRSIAPVAHACVASTSHYSKYSMYSVLTCGGRCYTPTITPACQAVQTYDCARSSRCARSRAPARPRFAEARFQSSFQKNHFYMPTVPSGALGFKLARGHVGSARKSASRVGIPTARRASPTPGSPRRGPPEALRKRIL
jgi:hypothetical protein